MEQRLKEWEKTQRSVQPEDRWLSDKTREDVVSRVAHERMAVYGVGNHAAYGGIQLSDLFDLTDDELINELKDVAADNAGVTDDPVHAVMARAVAEKVVK